MAQEWERSYVITKARSLVDVHHTGTTSVILPPCLRERREKSEGLPGVSIREGTIADCGGEGVVGDQEVVMVVRYVVQEMNGELFIELMTVMG